MKLLDCKSCKRDNVMILPRTLLLSACLSCMLPYAVLAEDNTLFTAAERSEYAVLSGKKAPKEKELEQREIINEVQKLKSRLHQLEQEETQLASKDIKMLDDDIAFWDGKVGRLVNNRTKLLEKMIETRESINKFNQAVLEFVDYQLSKQSHIWLGVPVFRRKEVYSSKSSSVLIVNLSYPVGRDMLAVGGEVITCKQGRVQFVVVQKQNDGFSVVPVGNWIDITEDDILPDGSSYGKTVMFSSNCVKMRPGDFWGMIVETRVGITCDSTGAGNSYVVPCSFLESASMKLDLDVDANIKQAGMAFSFNMFGRIKE